MNIEEVIVRAIGSELSCLDPPYHLVILSTHSSLQRLFWEQTGGEPRKTGGSGIGIGGVGTCTPLPHYYKCLLYWVAWPLDIY